MRAQRLIGAYGAFPTIAICCALIFGAFELQKNVCFSKASLLSKDAAIDAMIEKIVDFRWRFSESSPRQLAIYTDAKTGMRREIDPQSIIYYPTAGDFTEENPGCCKITESGYKADCSAYNTALGRCRYWVKAEFKVRYKDEMMQPSSFDARYWLPVTKCGKVWSGVD